MSLTDELADILANVTVASTQSVETVQEGMRVYLVDLSRRNASMNTLYNCFYDIYRFDNDTAHFDGEGQSLPLGSVTRNVIEAHLARLAQGKDIASRKIPSSHTVERRRRIIKAFVRWLYAEEYIQADPSKKLSPIKLRERFPAVWGLQEVARFLGTYDRTSFVGYRDYCIALVALSSGLRVGEISLLRPCDINLRTNQLSVSEMGKTGARTAVLTNDTVKELTRWLRRRESETGFSNSDPLFPSVNKGGTPKRDYLLPRSISQSIKNHARKAGITGVKLGAHSLRHTAASHLARQGASAFEIQQFLGHASVTMSQRYVQMTNAAVQRRVEEIGIMSQINREEENETGSKQAILDRLRRRR